MKPQLQPPSIQTKFTQKTGKFCNIKEELDSTLVFFPWRDTKPTKVITIKARNASSQMINDIRLHEAAFGVCVTRSKL